MAFRTAVARRRRRPPSADARELLRGSPWMGDKLSVDCQAFAERVLPRVSVDEPAGRVLADVLKLLTVGPVGRDEFKAAASAFREPETLLALRNLKQHACALRCDYYAAASGCADSAYRIAGEALSRASQEYVRLDLVVSFAQAAVGWLGVAAGDLLPVRDRLLWYRGADRSVSALTSGRQLLDQITNAAKAANKESPRAQADADDADAMAEGDGIIVIAVLGNAETAEGKRVATEYKALMGKRLPVTPMPDLVAVRRTLLEEFPHAIAVIDAVLASLAGQVRVITGPTVFVGSPGCGKSTFSERLLELLGVRAETYSCGGVADAALAGAARRWSSGEPCLPLNLIRRFNTASPGIVLDELEKAADSRHNGNLRDALLGFWEPRSATRWHDPYIEAPVDLSAVIWMATANSLAGVPAPLRDRARVLEFPDPGPEHLEMMAHRLLQAAAIADRGLDARWAVPLDGEELDALRQHWRGGSLRRLARLVEGVIAARERMAAVN